MKNMIRKRSLRTTICLMLVLAMFVTILPENVQAAVYTPGLTTDFAQLEPIASFQTYGKAGPGGAGILNTVLTIPEGDIVYLMYERHACNGMYIYSVFWKGRMWQVNAKDIVDLKATKFNSAYTEKWAREEIKGQTVKVKKTVLLGKITEPLKYYYVYANPKVTDGNVIGVYAAGGAVDIIKENYNAKWAEILFGQCVGYVQRAYLNHADAYLSGATRNTQTSIKQAKKLGLAKGIIKPGDYGSWIKKKDFCRLAVNWYKVTGHKLPKQSKKSPFTDTKDPYVIMAYQLGIVKSTKNKKFKPNEELLGDQYDALVKRLLRVAGAPSAVFDVMSAHTLDSYSRGGITRECALVGFYNAYRMLQKTDYLVNDFYDPDYSIAYTISPADHPKLCLDIYDKSTDRGASIGLWEKNDGKNQQFRIKEIHGFTLIYNVNSGKTLTGTDNGVYQEAIGYDCQKLSFKYNSDGTVSIINGNGLYLDVKDGVAKSGGELIWAQQSGSSSQKFVFNIVKQQK